MYYILELVCYSVSVLYCNVGSWVDNSVLHSQHVGEKNHFPTEC